ncbi:MAG: DUF937 domain-containing protein [Runella sp.]
MNIFASLREALSEGVIDQIAGIYGEKPEKIQQAFDVLGVSMVGGLVKRVTTESGMKFLFSQVEKNNYDLALLPQILQNPATLENFRSEGEKNLNTVLPGLKSPITSMVAKYAGIQNSLASTLCGLAVSVVMSLLKKETTHRKFDAEGLAAYLGDQREALLSVVPELNDALVKNLGLQAVLQTFSIPRSEASGSITHQSSPSATPPPFLMDEESTSTDFRPYLKWGAIVVLAGVAVAAGIYFGNQRSSLSNDTANDTDSTLMEARTIVEPPRKDTIATAATTTPVATTNSPMATYLADTTAKVGKSFKFENVDFEDNTTQLKATAQAPVQGLADLLKKYPTAQIKLVGYANDAQPPLTNKTLSVKRVYALKDQFIKAGISYVRVDAEGRGTGINPKDTTGRKQVAMREIWVKFVQK